jgi:transposase InsO family protein
MPRPYPPEFRQRALDLVRSGRSIPEVAGLLGIAQPYLYRWKQQDLIDRGLKAAGSASARLVKRQFTADGPNRLWVTDITEHPAREGKVYCCVVIDVFSRRVAGWAIDTAQRADLATNALGMAIDSRRPSPGAIIHGDHGTRFNSWAFTTRAKNAGLLPSLGTVGDPYDNAVVESFWGRMQAGLLNRKRWNTRVELANAIFEYIEGFHNRRRRHSALGWASPLEFETEHRHLATTPDKPFR